MRRLWIAVMAVAALGPFCPSAEAQSLGQVFKRVTASVVVVRTRERDAGLGDQGRADSVIVGLGSGVLISSDGKVLTASHVVNAVDEVSVEFLDGSVVGATVVTAEPEADVAPLQLERVPERAVVATLVDSDAVDVGDQVFIIGAPYGIGHTLTVGHISARHKPNTVYGGMSLAEFLQTDAAINQGNSGGPMFSLTGEVIGLVSHIISKSGGFEGLGFVVNMARPLLLERRSFWSGLDGYVLEGDLAKVFNVPQPVGLVVQRIAQRSPSAQIGLRGGTLKATIDGRSMTVGGDIILNVQGIPITGRSAYERIQERLASMHPGAQVVITVLREGRQTELIGRLP